MTIEERIEALEKLMEGFDELTTAEMRNKLLGDAKVMAIYSFVEELAAKADVSPENFLKHYELRLRYWHDYFLRQAEDLSPGHAAELDWRTLEQSAVTGPYPSMFDPPPSDNT